MVLAHRHGGWGFPAIALTVLGFLVWWPIGLATLAFVMWSAKMGHWHGCGGHRGWRGAEWRGRMRGGCGFGWWSGRDRADQPTGNQAFDEYRAETLRRLEEDQREFMAFLDRLRRAKDQAEFDQFMRERTRRPDQAEPPTHA